MCASAARRCRGSFEKDPIAGFEAAHHLDPAVVEVGAEDDGDLERTARLDQIDGIDAVPRRHGVSGYGEKGALFDGHQDQGPLADEIVAKIGDLDVGKHPAITDLGVDLDERALLEL